MLLLKNGYILENNKKVYTDILIHEDKILEIGKNITGDYETIDCNGCLITPGFIDVHVHFREPGFEYKETIETGCKAAAKGGYTLVMPMPNLKPCPDNVTNLQKQLDKIKETACIRVLPYATITIDEKGEQLVDFEALSQQPIFGFSDDGVGIQNAAMMLEAMKQAKKVNKPIVAHCEENSLIFNGVMHQGKRSEQLGLPGIPGICEATQIARDVLLAEDTKVHYHVCHVSSYQSVRVIKDAKKAGIHVSAEVSPHHLLCSEDDIPSDNGLWKMNPPLRSEKDRQALIEALLDGTIDMIATDHAPHSNNEKEGSFLDAKFGIVGLEDAFALVYTHLVKKGILSLQQLLDCMSKKPAEVFNLPYGKLTVGAKADITIIDLNQKYVIDRTQMVSKSNNTPFENQEVYGKIKYTICDGNIVWGK